MAMLRKVCISGFKSFKEMDLELEELNVLFGTSGSGKSNLVAFFKLLNEMMAGRLQQHIVAAGHAHSLLHGGPETTQLLEARLEFDVGNGIDTYNLRLLHTSEGQLVFAPEALVFHQKGYSAPKTIELGAGHAETRITREAEQGVPTAKVFRRLLNHCRVFDFHDTSPTSRVRQQNYVGNNRWLMPDAGNLAAFLLRLRNTPGGVAYQRIVDAIRRFDPTFDDFVLEPEGSLGHHVFLNWRKQGDDTVHGPQEISDITLRSMCLITLLLQPEDELPKLAIVDDPDRDLHLEAHSIFADLFKQAAQNMQVLITTRSTDFMSHFHHSHVIVVCLDGSESQFARLGAELLAEWLEECGLTSTIARKVDGA